jgi:hypothetical protein
MAYRSAKEEDRMNIEKFLTLGAELETRLSAVYEEAAVLAVDEPTSKLLKKISGEELNHAASLRMGKNYLAQAPDIFVDSNLSEEEINSGISEIDLLHTRLRQGSLLLPALKSLLDLEKRFEKIHIGVSVLITDVHLKQLFQALAKGDQNHIAALSNLIAGSE